MVYHIDTKGELTIYYFTVSSFSLIWRGNLAQYFDNVDLKSEIRKFNVKIFDFSFSFFSDNGVFCKDHLDFGTRLLLESIPWNEINGDILDVGCGYGPIGIIASRITNHSVTMCDVNKRALHLAKMNIKENNVDAHVLESNCYENITGLFDTIITNPPIRAGKKIVYEILFDAKKHLTSDGKLFLVIHKDQGAKSVIKDLEKEYNVDVLEKNKGFFVIKCKIR